MARQTVTPARMAGVTSGGRPWSIQVGSRLTAGRGGNEETVLVTAITPTGFTATFTRPHAQGFPITAQGNPGPWSRYNPAADADIVPFFSIIA